MFKCFHIHNFNAIQNKILQEEIARLQAKLREAKADLQQANAEYKKLAQEHAECNIEMGRSDRFEIAHKLTKEEMEELFGHST